MTRLRIGGISAFTPASRLRIGGISAIGSVNSTPRLRIGGISADGEVRVIPRLRIGGISAQGFPAVIIQDFTDLVLVNPGDPVTLVAVLSPGAPEPEEFVWTQLSGPPVDYTASTDTLSFLVPAFFPPGDSVEFGVSGRTGVTFGPITNVEVSPYPETAWYMDNTGGWLGARRLLS